MGGGAPDPEGKASAKRKRIDALDRRLAGGRGASSAARASVSRPGDLSRGRDGDRPSAARRDARGPRADGRGARDGNPASRPPFDAGRNAAPVDPSDAAWYAPLSSHTRFGVFAAAHNGSIPRELSIETAHGNDAVSQTRHASFSYVERTLVQLAETSARTGADVDAVVRQKTRDKVLLLDAANSLLTKSQDAKRSIRKQCKKAPSRLAQHSSNGWLRVRGVRGALPGASFADAQNARRALKPLKESHAAFLAGLVDAKSATKESEDVFGKRLLLFKRRVLELGEVRGGTVSVASCRDGKLVGRRGVVARVTKRTAHIVAEPTSETEKDDDEKKNERVGVFVAPRRGTTFRLELSPSFPGIPHGEGDASQMWVDIRGESLAGG